MASSGTYTETLGNAELIFEAFERCGRSPQSLGSEHLNSALRSMKLLFSEWDNEDKRLFHLTLTTHSVAVDETNFSLGAGVVDVVTVYLTRDSVDTPMYPISRDDYANLPDKDVTGLPTRYWIDRKATPVFYYWEAGENVTDVINYFAIMSFEDVGTLSQDPDAVRRWWEPICAGLAAKLAVKFAPERVAMLDRKAAGTFKTAQDSDSERAPILFRPYLSRKRRRHR